MSLARPHGCYRARLTTAFDPEGPTSCFAGLQPGGPQGPPSFITFETSSAVPHRSDSAAGEVRFELWDERTAGTMQQSASHGETAAAVAKRNLAPAPAECWIVAKAASRAAAAETQKRSPLTCSVSAQTREYGCVPR